MIEPPPGAPITEPTEPTHPTETAPIPISRRSAERSPGPGPTTFGSTHGSWRGWIRPLLVITVLALGLRLAMVLVVHPTCEFDADKWAQGAVSAADFEALKYKPDGCFQVGGDALYLFLQGRMLSDGHGYASPVFLVITGRITPGAGKPPAWPTAIGLMNVVGLRTPTDVRLVAALVGAAGVLLLGHIAGRIAGRRAAIIAAIIAALYPMLWINDWKMLNDGPMILASVVVVYAAFNFWARPRPRSACFLGAAIAVAALTRSEGLQLLVFLVIPLCWFMRRFSPSVRLRLMVVIGLTTVALYMPWISYNLARFNEKSVAAGNNTGSLTINSSCDSAWYGTNTGYLDFACIDLASQLRVAQIINPARPTSDESDMDVAFRQQANAYMQANLARAPAVVAARVGRSWDVYKPRQNLEFNINLEGRGRIDSTAGSISYFALMPWAIGGLVILYRRRVTIVPFVALALMTTATAALSFGITRYRVPVDAAMCVLAAVAFDAFMGRYMGAGRSSILGDLREMRVRPPSWSVRTWALVLVPALVMVGVVVWSAGVEPPAKATPPNPTVDPAQSTTLPTDPTQAACLVIKANGLGDRAIYDQLSPETIGSAIEAFKQVEAVGPPQVVADAKDIRTRFEIARDRGFVAGRMLDALSSSDRLAVTSAGLGFITFAQRTCT